METPFLDQLIEEHQNHIESVEASSYAGIQETRKQLAELEAIKAIIVTHSCNGEAEQFNCFKKQMPNLSHRLCKNWCGDEVC